MQGRVLQIKHKKYGLNPSWQEAAQLAIHIILAFILFNMGNRYFKNNNRTIASYKCC